MKNLYFIILLTLGNTFAIKFDEFPFLMGEIEHNACNDNCSDNITINPKNNTILKCSEMNKTFEDLIEIDNNISNFRTELLKFTQENIDNNLDKEEKKTKMNSFTDKYNLIKENLNNFKKILMDINYSCDQLLFIMLNIENHLNNVDYLLENDCNKYIK
jgi:hypothetical protein